MEKLLERVWWELAIRGLVAILFGVLAIFWPGLTLALLILFVGAFIFVDGTFAVVGSLKKRKSNKSWWLTLISGLFGIGIGIIAFFWTDIFGLTLLILIAAWAIVTGLMEIIVPFKLPKDVKGKWLLPIGGIVSVIFGIVMVSWPGATALALVLWIGIFAIFIGILMLAVAFKVRSWTK